MNDYTPYRHTFRTHEWTHIPVRDEWQDPKHVFGGRCFLKYDIRNWLKDTPGSSYAILDDEDNFINHAIAFARPCDATLFLLRWS